MALPIVDRTLRRQNLPLIRAPIIGSLIENKLVPLVKNKLASDIEAKVNRLMPNQRRKGRRRRRKQRGKGVVGDLLKEDLNKSLKY